MSGMQRKVIAAAPLTVLAGELSEEQGARLVAPHVEKGSAGMDDDLSQLSEKFAYVRKFCDEMEADCTGEKSVAYSQARHDSIDMLFANLFRLIEKGLEHRRDLEKRVSDLEGGGIKYCGVHQRALAYKRGDVTTSDGGAWIALQDTAGERPGEGSAWQLMVKPGRDGRDGHVRS